MTSGDEFMGVTAHIAAATSAISSLRRARMGVQEQFEETSGRIVRDHAFGRSSPEALARLETFDAALKAIDQSLLTAIVAVRKQLDSESRHG